ncbi:DUF6387 family protein [Gilvimarinus sp. SDUM040013]|uniref:DUF6387 family protein n=1 Tax=Gilvimarinus gilvus TaxID=3058038 RepID=A0ABU4S0R8_9GAMM|nr:DUF6387 family protein [Gilvimarinus sp. SDUM040013]MDO3387202.1 DUF6387 family protein [Gilvimarinus sp. SDUM040013]MDX6850765.1 DUF6387 family protein [Gilvimarinus sp. SDUM040013]
MADKKGQLPYADIKDLEWCDLSKYRRQLASFSKSETLLCLAVSFALSRLVNCPEQMSDRERELIVYDSIGREEIEDLKAIGPNFYKRLMGAGLGVDVAGTYDYEFTPSWSDRRISTAVAPLSLIDATAVYDGVEGAEVPELPDYSFYPADFALLANQVFSASEAHFSVDLEATNAEILQALEKILPLYRDALRDRGVKFGFREFKEIDYSKIIDYRVIEYFHIKAWAGVQGVMVRDTTFGNYLLGDAPVDTTPADRFRRTVKRDFISKFDNPVFIENLISWAKHDFKKARKSKK